MAEVERIDGNIANEVRAGAVVSTMSQAVQELISNSMDAGATSVEIKLDLPRYRLSIADNGRGIPADKLQSLVATAQASSKASSTEEIQQASTYGFRGEALYSLGLTSLLEIQSRCPGKESHAKVVREGQTQFFGPTRLPMRGGTIVTLRDAFFKWPVRRKAANEAAEITRIKEHVARMALMNNNVAITVLDSAKSKIVLKAAATGSVTKTFAQIFASDKLSLCRKLTFNFKQFRLTGYISPPSSSACHWSKEFQFVYVNCRSVRRLEFLQKVINSAFAPCLALLCGRGGADGQGVRRVRNPNASSGQKQELFPVFVLNLECPRKEVDVMVEAEKTWVEFSDWAAAKNACVAMLLAFLPHFPHAVPSSVLRDLRRAFHKNEGDEAWRMAGSPPTTRRNSTEPTPSPSPSPMRLGMPGVGVGSPPDGCAWMGRDRDSGTISKGGKETIAKELQREGSRAEVRLCRPPAWHVDDCDSGPSLTAGLPFGTMDSGCPLAGLHPTHDSPYFTQLDQQHHVSWRDSRQPRRLALDEEEVCDNHAGPHRPDSEAGSLYVSTYDETTVADNDGGKREDGVLTEKVHESCGYMEGGGWAAETPGARSHNSDQLPPRRRPSLEHEHCPQLADGRERGWLRRLPSVAQEIVSGEELNQGEFSVADGSVTPSLSSLFAYAFPDDDQHQGWLPESRASRRSGVGGSTHSKCSGVAGTDRNSPHITSSLPPVLPGDGAKTTMIENNPLVGITVRRPRSPQFSFMAENCSPDASIFPATSPKPRTPEDGQQREQGKSCVNSIGTWMSGSNRHEDDSAQSTRPSGFFSEDDAETPTASTPVIDDTGPVSAQAGRMTGDGMRVAALSRKRKHPEAREAIAPRESHRSPSAGYDGASSTSEDGACFGSRRHRGDRRKEWWGATNGYKSPAVHNQAAAGASRLPAEVVSRGKGNNTLRKKVEASGATGAGRYEPATAGDSAPCETEISKRSTGRNDKPTTVAGDGEMSHVEGVGRRGGGDGKAALAYDQDVLGGEGAAEAGVGSFEPQTVADILGKLSYRFSSAGGAAVQSPDGAGGSRAPKAESAAGARPALRGRERPIPQVLQAGHDEIGAGAGAVAVKVTREELGQSFLIGQAGRKFIILRARTGAILCVDQHAADERIKLEQLERQVFGEDGDRRNVEVLHLDPPESVSITQSDASLLQLHREVLSSWKFEFVVEQAQGISGCAPTANLVSVPVVCGVRLSVQDLVGFLTYLRESMEPGSLAGKPPQIQHILNYKACHGAIRFGDLLSRSESLELVRQLAACAHPFVCAHGRPSVVPLCVVGGTLPLSKASIGPPGRGRSAATSRGRKKLPTSGERPNEYVVHSTSKIAGGRAHLKISFNTL